MNAPSSANSSAVGQSRSRRPAPTSSPTTTRASAVLLLAASAAVLLLMHPADAFVHPPPPRAPPASSSSTAAVVVIIGASGRRTARPLSEDDGDRAVHFPSTTAPPGASGDDGNRQEDRRGADDEDCGDGIDGGGGAGRALVDPMEAAAAEAEARVDPMEAAAAEAEARVDPMEAAAAEAEARVDPMEAAAAEAEALDDDEACPIDDLDCMSTFDDYFRDCDFGVTADGECLLEGKEQVGNGAGEGEPQEQRQQQQQRQEQEQDDGERAPAAAAPSEEGETATASPSVAATALPMRENICDDQDEDCIALLFGDDNDNDYDDRFPLPPSLSSSSSPPFLSDAALASSLRSRRSSLAEARILRNWRTDDRSGHTTAFVPVSSDDWVRRVAMDQYPIVVCGGAGGGVYVVNVEDQKVLAVAERAHIVQVESEPKEGGKDDGSKCDDVSGKEKRRKMNRKDSAVRPRAARSAMEALYGKIDGGGVVAVAIRGSVVASAGREGGVRLWNLAATTAETEAEANGNDDDDDGGEPDLASAGEIRGLERTIATSLKFDTSGKLWAACYDGTVRSYDVSFAGSGTASVKPLSRTDFQDSVLDMHLCEELGVGVCATADGGAALFDIDSDGQFFVGILLFEGRTAARSVVIVKHRSGDDDNVEEGLSEKAVAEGPTHDYSVVCGGMDGALHRIALDVDPITGRLNRDDPFLVDDTTDTSVRPRHAGPVMCLTAPTDGGSANESGAARRREPSGVFVSGGQDGSMRVWDCATSSSLFPPVSASALRSRERRDRCRCMYALTGYRLWLGSACTDGARLVSDGGENSLVVRDFGGRE